MSEKAKIGILGTGSWGNTLSFLFGQTKKVIIWDRNKERARMRQKTRRFKKPMVQKYPDGVTITSDLNDLLECELIINAISVKGISHVFESFKGKLPKSTIILNGSKGVEADSLMRPSEIISSVLPDNPVAVLSGPNLAKEVLQGKPMVSVVACKDPEVAKKIQELILEPTLRVYTNADVTGVELAGAMKNIIAIAAGILDGLDQGTSAKASLLTRGLAEMANFMSANGAEKTTLLGAAGVGDMIATCGSELSRNYRVGYYLAKGKNLAYIVETLGEVAEGINTTHAIYRICKEKNIQMPIVEQIKGVLDNNSSPVDAVLNLMNRPVGSELEV